MFDTPIGIDDLKVVEAYNLYQPLNVIGGDTNDFENPRKTRYSYQNCYLSSIPQMDFQDRTTVYSI